MAINYAAIETLLERQNLSVAGLADSAASIETSR
jgi:hypothetical protein